MFDIPHGGRLSHWAGVLLTSLLLTGCQTSASEPDGISVSWQAGPVLLEANDFYVEAGGVRFQADTRAMLVDGDPGVPGERTTLELFWREHDVEMRLFIYFQSDLQEWWSNEIRIYNGREDGDWIYFEEELFRRPLGMPFEGDIHLTAETEGIPGVIHFDGLRLEAYRTVEACAANDLPLALDVRTPEIALTAGAELDARVYLLSGECLMIADQTSVTYEWSVDDPELVAVAPAARCLPPILEPCPEMAADLTGLQPGQTTVRVRVSANYNGSPENVLVAENTMLVTVTEMP